MGGQGTRILPDKTEIKATFKGGLPEGPGQIRYPDGGTYTDFAAGYLQWAAGAGSGRRATYEGQWNKSRMHGQGWLSFANGSSYKGLFRMGLADMDSVFSEGGKETTTALFAWVSWTAREP